MTSKIKNLFVFSFVFLALFFSKNSNSSDMPTDTDVTNEINVAFSECGNLSVTNIEKINGLKENDQIHQVSIKYEITSKPLFNNKELWDNFKNRKEKIENEYENFQIKKKSITHQEGMNEFYEKNSEIMDNIRSLEKEKVEIRDKMSRTFLRDCNYKDSHFVLDNLNLLFGDYENYGREIKAIFEANVKMVKTDNGWMLMTDHRASKVSMKELSILNKETNNINITKTKNDADIDIENQLINATRFKSSTKEREKTSRDIIKIFKENKVIAENANKRLDYTDYYITSSSVKFMGADIILVEEEYMNQNIGCCVNPGFGFSLRKNENTDILENFAKENGCTLDNNLALSEKLSGLEINYDLPQGEFAYLSCRENDIQ